MGKKIHKGVCWEKDKSPIRSCLFNTLFPVLIIVIILVFELER